jgi:hypothetical protein
MLRPICDTEPMDDEAMDRLRAARAGLAATRAAVEALAPWPLATTIDDSAEAQWGPPEVLAHVAEMIPYWHGEMERVLAGSPEPVPFGRISSDPIRIGVLARDRSLPPGELYERTIAALDRLERRLTTLTATELGRRGLHPTRGEMTVGAMPERFVIGHLADHVVQLETLLADRPTDA